MEFLTFLAVLAILIILLINISSINGRLNDLLKEVERLREALSRNEKRDSEKPASSPDTVTKPETVQRPESLTDIKPTTVSKPVTASEEPVISSYEDTIKDKLEAMNQPEPVTSSYEDTVKAKLEAINQTQVSYQSTSGKPEPPITPKAPKQSTDLEKFVGENLISKIGIIILVLGVGFFVKYAIDQKWIGVYGRTAIGLLTGGTLVSLAHYLRKSYKTFSSLLTGGGFAVFYLTIAIAFHQYNIFSPSMAFVIMIVITIFSVLLSLAYDKKELAVFSQLGGYAAPFMVSTGEGNYIVLFSYLLILNGGLLVLAYFKRWHILNLLAFVFTLIIFSGWLATFWGTAKLPYLNAMIFATAFYVVFFLANILNNIKERQTFKAAEIMMILSNNLFYFLWGIAILYPYRNGMYKGLFTVMAGLFNFGWVLYLYRKKQVDKNLIYLLIALVMTFISLAVPIQLDGHSITLFWTAELVILLYLSQVSGIRILKTGHLIILSFVIISLMMDWGNLYGNSFKVLPVVINQAFITGLFVIAGLIVSALLLRKEKDEMFVKNIFSTSAYRNVLTFALLAATFVIPFLELNYQVRVHYPVNSFQIVISGIYIYAYLFVVLFITRSPNWQKAFQAMFILSWIALFLYLVIFHMNVLYLRDSYIYGKIITTGNFLFHYLAIPFVIGVIWILNKRQRSVLLESGFLSGLFSWFVSFMLVFIASAELDNILILVSDVTRSSYNQVLEVSHKVGYPILWGVCAFVLITLGIKYKNKLFRIQALSLFALIILKLFLFDVWNMSEGGRIAAFVFLGVVLLLVSFLYQKLKNLLLDSKENLSNVE